MPFSPIPSIPSAKRSVSSGTFRAAAWTAATLVIVTALKVAAFDYIGSPTPFLLYFAPIIIGAWFGGWAGGFTVTAASAALGTFFFLPPFRSLAIRDVATSVHLFVFVAEGVAITAITTRLRMQQAHTKAAALEAKALLAQLEGVLRGVADGITVQTARGELRYVNDIAARLTGFDSAVQMLAAPTTEIMKRFELLEPDGSPFDVKHLPGRLVLQGLPAPERLIQFKVRATGQARFALVRAMAVELQDASGATEPVAVNVFQDVTEKREEEERRRELGEWLATTLRSIGDAVIATDAQGRIRFMNPLAERLTGTSSGQAEGQTLSAVFRILNEDTREPVESPVDRVLREGQVVALANHAVLIARDGSERAIDDSAAPIRSAKGELVGTVLVFRDVSERRADERRRDLVARAAAELASSLDYNQTLATLVRLTVPVICDWCALDVLEDGRLCRLAVQHVDPEKIALVYEIERRYPADPERGDGAYGPLRTGQPVFVPEITDAMLVSSARDEEHLHLIRTLRLSSYVAVPLRVHGNVIGVLTLATAESGRVLGHLDVEVAVALAERAAQAVHHARLFAAAEAARAEAERANRAKDEFLAMLGHELRNPLAPMLTAVQLMKMRAPEAVPRERAILERQMNHVVKLIDDLLDVSRITRGKLELDREPVDLADTVRKALEVAAPMIEKKRHHVTTEMASRALVMGDQTRLVQVFANLIVNAAKYTDAGGRIEVMVRRAGSDWEFRVRDNGAGISADLLPRVFDLFMQGTQPLNREKGGLGLGLAIVRSLVDVHHGRVFAESAGEGKGSEFRVALPAADDIAPAAHLPAPASLPSMNTRVLVVDDNQDALDLMAEGLRFAGFEVQTALDAATALVRAEAVKPEIVVVDIGLPVMDGYELAQRIRELPGLERAKLVALTGYGQAADKRRAAEAGFHAHLVKPISLEHLERTLTRIVRGGEHPATA